MVGRRGEMQFLSVRAKEGDRDVDFNLRRQTLSSAAMTADRHASVEIEETTPK